MNHERLKIGVVVFSYAGFTHFQREWESFGSYSVNLGDNMQTLAVRSALEEIGVDSANVVDVDRDTLRHYAGPPVAVVLNGVFHAGCFPLPSHVRPIFLGFRLDHAAIKGHAGYFREQGPIGCRDTDTMRAFQAIGADAYVSGCLTMSLRPRSALPACPRTFVIYGANAGAFPWAVLGGMPRHLLRDMELVYQRFPSTHFPVERPERIAIERHAARLLDDYRERAGLVVTSLHHAATPCIGSGIPVILCRDRPDSRFSFLSELLPVYGPEDYHAIDWNPPPLDVGELRGKQLEWLRSAIKLAVA
jgi:hypothetical protein